MEIFSLPSFARFSFLLEMGDKSPHVGGLKIFGMGGVCVYQLMGGGQPIVGISGSVLTLN